MNGRRCKALRREFAKKFGRLPERGRCVRKMTGREIEIAEPTRIHGKKSRIAAVVAAGLKMLGRPEKAARAAKAAAAIVARVLRSVFTMEVTEPSEWRRWKKRRALPGIPELESAARQRESDARFEAELLNNDRIKDTRSKKNQAYGKMKRAGVFATRRRG